MGPYNISKTTCNESSTQTENGDITGPQLWNHITEMGPRNVTYRKGRQQLEQGPKRRLQLRDRWGRQTDKDDYTAGIPTCNISHRRIRRKTPYGHTVITNGIIRTKYNPQAAMRCAPTQKTKTSAPTTTTPTPPSTTKI